MLPLHEAHRLMTLGHMVPGIIHKQHNLFHAIIGYCDLALRQVAPDHPAYEDIAGARAAAIEAAEHTTDLLEKLRQMQAAPRADGAGCDDAATPLADAQRIPLTTSEPR